MTDLANNCDGTNGNAIPATNVAGPNAFNTSTKSGTGTTATFDNAQIHSGTTAVKFALAAVSSTDYVDWSGLTSTANAYLRCYVYLTAAATAQTRMFAYLGSAALRCSVIFPTASLTTLRTINSAGSTISTMTSAFPLNQWVRVEFELTGVSGTTGTVACRMYSGANLEGTTPDSGGSISASNSSIGGNVDDARIGMSSAVTMTSAWNAWYDDVAYSDVAQPGALVTATETVSPIYVVASQAAHQSANW